MPSALVIGTFAPDFEYFLRLAPDRGFGHTLPGTFALTLPAALLVLWIFHSLVKWPATMLMPDPIRNRLVSHLGDFRFGGAGRFLLILASLLLGIATHLLWDSFTHANTWFYAHWPLLRAFVHLPILGPIPYYKIFQHCSTVVGTGVVAAWLVLWYRNSEPSPRVSDESLSPRQRLAVVATMVLVATVGTIIRIVVGTSSPVSFKKMIGETIVTAIALVWWQLVVYAFIQRRALSGRPSSHTV